MSAQSPFGLAYAAGVLEQIRTIKGLAEQAGQEEQFLTLMEEALRRLRDDPHGWGDPLYHAKHVNAVACRGLLPPLMFHYVIYDDINGVMLLSVELYVDF